MLIKVYTIIRYKHGEYKMIFCKRVTFLKSIFFYLCLSMPNLVSVSSSVTPEFGKTHFIVGLDHAQYLNIKKNSKKVSAKSGSSRANSGTKVFFSPDDGLQKKLIDLIDKELESIKIAIYILTDLDIAHALVRAKKRGVEIQIIVEPSQMKEKHSKINLLQDNGILVFEYDPDYIKGRQSTIMHHKFVIFGTAESEDGLVWTGSFNFTQAANHRNQENAVLITDIDAIAQFLAHYEKLKKRCRNCAIG